MKIFELYFSFSEVSEENNRIVRENYLEMKITCDFVFDQFFIHKRRSVGSILKCSKVMISKHQLYKCFVKVWEC